MGKTIGKFNFRIIKMGAKPKMPFNPIVTITLDSWSTTEDKVPVISPHLMTEIDYHVKALKDDLDVMGSKAKAALRKALEEVRRYKSN